MLSRYNTTKPLYSYERSLDYQKHKRKLMQIQTKSPNTVSSKSPQDRPWVKQKLKNEFQKQNRLIQQQNEKLLFKLMKISTRNTIKINSMNPFNNIAQNPPKQTQTKNNPYRKNWLKNIKKQNQQLGQKLLNLRSSLEYSRFSKSIGEYEKVKKSMMINRRPKLPQLGLKQSGSDYLKVNAKTEPTIDDVPIKTNKTEDINNMNDEQKAKQKQKTISPLQLRLNKIQFENKNNELQMQIQRQRQKQSQRVKQSPQQEIYIDQIDQK